MAQRPDVRILLPPLRIMTMALILGCSHPTDPTDLAFHRGQNALAEGRFDQARHFFTSDLETHPKRLDSLRGLGIAWSQGLGNSQSEAVRYFRAFLDHQDDPEIRWRLAQCLWNRGEDTEALAVLDPVELESLGTDLAMRTRLLEARLLLKNDPSAARQQALPAADHPPTAGAARVLLAEAFSREGHDERALPLAKSALYEHDPFNPRIAYLVAQIARRLGQNDEAARVLELWQQLRRLPSPSRPDVSPREEWRVLEGLRDADPRLQGHPFTVRQAGLLLELGRLAEAQPHLEVLRERPETTPEELLNLARSALRARSIRPAEQLLEALLERDGDHRTGLAQRTHLAIESGDLARAAELRDRGLNLAPHHAPFHFNSGLLALEHDDSDAAIDALTRAIDLAPWQSRYRLTLAEVYLTLGRPDDLRLLLERAPEDPTIDAFRRKHLLHEASH